MQHSLREKIILYFSRRRRWGLWVFESVCICENLRPKIRICFEFLNGRRFLTGAVKPIWVLHRRSVLYPHLTPGVKGLTVADEEIHDSQE
jgi:hypothetical protein